MGVGCLGSVEPAFQGAFRRYGLFLSRRRGQIGASVSLAFLAVGFGIVAMHMELDPLELRISERGRIRSEKAFFEDSFEDKSPDTGAFVIEPREPGANLLAPDRVAAVLDEVRDLQEWIRTFEYEHRDGRSVTLESICYRPVGLSDTEPCFQYSILDCFAEGRVFAPGGENNTEFADLYSARPSYRDFDFGEDFTEEYVRRRCVQWFNLGTADTMFLGSPGTTSNSRGEPVVDRVEALRVVFGTKPKQRLARDGLVDIAFTPVEDGDSCLTSTDCGRCVPELDVSDAAAQGCTPSGNAQVESCCDFMRALREAPCVEPLFQAKPQVESLGNLVFGACGIPTLVLEKRCANKLAIRGVPDLCACVDSPGSPVCAAAVREFAEAGEVGGVGETDGRRLLQDGADSAIPDVCVCLADNASPECSAAGTEYLRTNPGALNTFAGARVGNEAALAGVRDILFNEVGCPEVCTCLGDSSSDECVAAGVAFANATPSVLAAFQQASQGNETAIGEVNVILTTDVGCPVPAAAVEANGSATESSSTDGGAEGGNAVAGSTEGDNATDAETSTTKVPDVCVCLVDSNSPECAEAGLAFATANPASLPTFVSASTGDEAAIDEVGEILVNDAGCPSVCRCLGDSSSPACRDAGIEYTSSNPSALSVFLAASQGDAAAKDGVRKLLIEEVGCAVPAGNGDDQTKADVPEVCVCLSAEDSDECGAAGLAYATANPAVASTFLSASQGDEAAEDEVGEILVNDAGCPSVCRCLADLDSPKCLADGKEYAAENADFEPLFAAARRNESAIAEVEQILINDAGCPGSGEDVCVCLEDSSSPECSTAAEAYAAANPDALAAFFAAAPNQDAIAQVREILQTEVGCPVAFSNKFPSVNLCSKDPASAECSSAVMDVFSDAATNPSAMDEVSALLASSLVSGVQCPSQTADVESVPSEKTVSATPAAAASPQQRQRFMANPMRIPLKDEDEAWDIVDGWEHAWRNEIEAKVKDYKTIKVSWFSSTLPDDLIEDAAEAQAPLILGGYALVLIYMIFYFMISFEDGKPAFSQLPPGPFSAILAFFAIIVGVFGTFGIIGLVSLTEVKVSPITPQVVPLLMVGLGINDFFVMASSLRVTLGSTKSHSFEEIMGETLAKGGTSITLSSLSITAAFALGALSPVPAIEWFSVHMAIGVVVAYIISITTIPCILAWALERHLIVMSDTPRCCTIGRGPSRGRSAMRAAVAAGQQPAAGTPQSLQAQDRSQGSPATKATAPNGRRQNAGAPEKAGSTGVGWFFKRALHSPLYRAAILLLFAAWVGFGAWGATKVERGLNISETVPKDSNAFDFFSAMEEHFNTFPVYVVFRDDQEFSDLTVFNQSRATEFSFVDQAHNMDRGYKTTSFLNYYTEYVESKFCAEAVCLAEVEWYWDGFHSEEYASVDDKLKNKCFDLGSGQSCAKKCEEHCPQGPPGSPFRCRLSEDKQGCYCPWRPKLKPDLFYENPEGYSIESFWTDFLNSTSKGGVTQSLVDFDGNVTERNKFGKPMGVRSIAFVEDVPNVPDIIEHIQSGRAAISSVPVDAFPFDFLVYGIGEQYESITRNTLVALGISIVVAAMVMMPLIVHWLAAVLVTLCVASAVVIGTGMIHWIGLQLNYTSFVALIVSVGLSVEFCSHITRDFMLSEGTRQQRAYRAVKEMGLAVLNGGVTTLLGLVPVAFSEYPYFREYFFMQYSLVVVIGLFVGLIVLPVLLSIIGPKSFAWKAKPLPVVNGAAKGNPDDSAGSLHDNKRIEAV
eukprot:evm.model.scf_60.23 EVM.evm.TU.scf_60.23   scf_60:170676-175982(-)